MKKKYYLLSIVMLFVCLFIFSTKAEASVQKLKVGVSYTRKLTGTKDYRIRYTQPIANKYYKDLKIFIDGKAVKYISGIKNESLSYDVYLLNIATNRTLIAIRARSDADLMSFMNLYEYKGGKFNFIVNFCDLTRNTTYEKANCLLTPWARCQVRSAQNNKIILTWTEQTPATGNIAINVAYQVVGTKVSKIGYSSEIRVSASNMDNPKWTANRDLFGKSSPGSGSISVKIKKGQKATLKAMTVRNGQRYMQLIAEDGSKGWIFVPKFADVDPLIIKDPEGLIVLGYFKECRFAG